MHRLFYGPFPVNQPTVSKALKETQSIDADKPKSPTDIILSSSINGFLTETLYYGFPQPTWHRVGYCESIMLL